MRWNPIESSGLWEKRRVLGIVSKVTKSSFGGILENPTSVQFLSLGAPRCRQRLASPKRTSQKAM